MNEKFRKLATKVSSIAGNPRTFAFALIVICLWAVSGPIFHYSTSWQLVINTGTSIITFFMVFLIQNTQNRDTKAIHLKLDELIKNVKGARSKLIDIEQQEDVELEELQAEFQKLHQRYVETAKKRQQKNKEKH